MISPFSQERRAEIKSLLEKFREGPKKRISVGLVDVKFSDIADALRGIDMKATIPPTKTFDVLKLDKKMDINQLTEETRQEIHEAILASPLVSDYVRKQVQSDNEDFPERLTKCFRLVYEEYAYNGYKGDDLYDVITANIIERSKVITDNGRAAVSALQAYLFERCEIFKTRDDETAMRKKWGDS